MLDFMLLYCSENYWTQSLNNLSAKSIQF